MAWSVNGQSPEARSISDIRIEFVSRGIDVCTFRMDKDYDSAAGFSFGASLSVSGPVDFRGTVFKVVRNASGGSEAVTVTAYGPWWDLSRIMFQQEWNVSSDPTTFGSPLIGAWKSRAILGHSIIAGSSTAQPKKTQDEILTEILEYAISVGANLQVGTIDLDADVPYAEIQDLSCAEAIERVLQFSPDAIIGFDHTTSPPTCNIRSFALAPSQATAIDNTVMMADVTARQDLQVPGVRIIYEQTDSIDETSSSTTVIDEVGTPDDAGGVILTVELGGASRNFQRQAVTVEAISNTSSAWWQKKIPWLADATGITLSAGEIVGSNGSPSGFGNELVAGQIPPWMPTSVYDRVTVKAKLTCSYFDANGAGRQLLNEPISVVVTATSLASLNYDQLVSVTDAEPVPVGLAQKLYDSASILNYEGSFTKTGSECTSSFTVGAKVTVGGYGPGQIQVVTHNVSSGETTVRFGPPNQRTLGDWVEILRSRTRTPSYRVRQREDGIDRNNKGEMQGPLRAPEANSNVPASNNIKTVLAPGAVVDASVPKITTEVSGSATKIVIEKTVGTNAGMKIEMNLADILAITGAPAATVIKAREIAVCESGVEKKMIVLCSQTYT